MKPVELFIHFDEADPARIVFFGNYYRLAHRAMELTLTQWGLKWEDFFRHPEAGFPVRHTEADYLKPLPPGQPVYIWVHPEKLGESSLTFRSEFRAKPDSSEALCSVVRVVHVSVDKEKRTKSPLPQDLVTKLTPFLKSF